MAKDVKFIHISPLLLCFEMARLSDSEFVEKFEAVLSGRKDADWCVGKEYYQFDKRMLSQKNKNIVLKMYGNVCLRCGAREKLEVDHVIPYSKGGDTSIENSQVLCRSCNSWKRDKHIDFR